MIIRTRQTFLARLRDVLCTLLAWALFFWLVLNGIDKARGLRQVIPVETESRLFSTIDSLLIYLGLALLVSLILLGWAKYNQLRYARYERRQRIPIIQDRTLCQAFMIEPSLLPLLQQEQVMTIFNDDEGNIDSALLASRDKALVMQLPLSQQNPEAMLLTPVAP